VLEKPSQRRAVEVQRRHAGADAREQGVDAAVAAAASRERAVVRVVRAASISAWRRQEGLPSRAVGVSSGRAGVVVGAVVEGVQELPGGEDADRKRGQPAAEPELVEAARERGWGDAKGALGAGQVGADVRLVDERRPACGGREVAVGEEDDPLGLAALLGLGAAAGRGQHGLARAASSASSWCRPIIWAMRTAQASHSR